MTRPMSKYAGLRKVMGQLLRINVQGRSFLREACRQQAILITDAAPSLRLRMGLWLCPGHWRLISLGPSPSRWWRRSRNLVTPADAIQHLSDTLAQPGCLGALVGSLHTITDPQIRARLTQLFSQHGQQVLPVVVRVQPGRWWRLSKMQIICHPLIRYDGHAWVAPSHPDSTEDGVVPPCLAGLESHLHELYYRDTVWPGNLDEAFCRAANWYGAGRVIFEDWQDHRVTYRQFRLRVLMLSRWLAMQGVRKGNVVACLLPNGVGYAVTLFALWRLEAIPALLNPTLGAAYVQDTMALSGANWWLSSSAFLARLTDDLTIDNAPSLLDLDRVKSELGWQARFSGLWALFSECITGGKRWGAVKADQSQDDTAVILFTSGSEGVPKGVMLSHRNLLHNIAQTDAVLDISWQRDKIFNPLPMFHSFGLNVGCLVPCLLGIPTYLYLSPLHYRAIPERVAASQATILLGTQTFLRGYAKKATAKHFERLRMVVAGAEKLQLSTAAAYCNDFGVTIYEGYGATEASPVITINTPMHQRLGTVGRVLPGIQVRLMPFAQLQDAYRLWIRGANVMKGYLADQHHPQAWGIEAGGWYDTGDIVRRDHDGYITLVDRAKRFAKVGGEMVSLTAVEREIATCWPQSNHAVVAIAHETTGERLVWVSDDEGANLGQLREHIKTKNLPLLAMPIRLLVVETMPVTATGKVDYPEVLRQVRMLMDTIPA